MAFVASGKIGSVQRAFLAAALAKLGQLGLFRVVLIHHPPLPGQAGWRRGLRDAKKIRDILVANGAELILHGHNHEQTIRELETATGTASIVGVPSASEAVEGRVPAARYNEYLIARAGHRWSCEMIGRVVASAPEHVWEVERRTLKVG
jgi:3',5'-cyclic AMP phosphodiesterase CpdA